MQIVRQESDLYGVNSVTRETCAPFKPELAGISPEGIRNLPFGIANADFARHEFGEDGSCWNAPRRMDRYESVCAL